MKKLSKKSYWEKLYDEEGFNKYSKLKEFFSHSLQNYEYYQLIKKFLKKRHKTIIEIGCAPGIYLIKAKKQLNLKPYGVEYTKKGIKLTKKNFKINNIKDYELYYSDFFDKKFQKSNRKKFDVVMSNGFVEHFDNFKKTMECHANITKINGLVVVNVPNLLFLNKYFTIQEVHDICYEDIMKLEYIKKNLPSNLSIKFLGYYGGLFNSGLYFYKNIYLELLRKIIFMGQRLILDPIFIMLSYLGIKFNWKYTSPGIALICEREK